MLGGEGRLISDLKLCPVKTSWSEALGHDHYFMVKELGRTGQTGLFCVGEAQEG